MPRVLIPEKSMQLWLNPNRQATLEALLDGGWDVRRVVVAWKRDSQTLADLCASRGVPFAVAKNADLDNLWAEYPAALLLSVGFGRLLPQSFIDSLPLAVNIHPSLLPRYRGRSTIVWGLTRGDTECGLSLHRIDAGMDTGDILAQRALPLSPFDTPRSLMRKLLTAEPDFTLEALEALAGEGLKPWPQPDHDAPPLPNREPRHSELDPSRPLAELYDSIRATDPERFPAYFHVAGQKVCIRLWRPDKPHDEEDMI